MNYHPVEPDEKLSQMSSSTLHRLLTDYYFVNAVFSKITGKAKLRIKAIQSIMMKRGATISGLATTPEENLKRPIMMNDTGTTDHAIVRYLERVKGVNIEEIEREMLESVKNGTSYFNGAVVVDQNNNSYIMREDGLVKTVMPQDWLREAENIAAQESFRIKRQTKRNDHFRALAKAGLDTNPTKRMERD